LFTNRPAVKREGRVRGAGYGVGSGVVVEGLG